MEALNSNAERAPLEVGARVRLHSGRFYGTVTRINRVRVLVSVDGGGAGNWHRNDLVVLAPAVQCVWVAIGKEPCSPEAYFFLACSVCRERWGICPDCYGEGVLLGELCPTCKGRS